MTLARLGDHPFVTKPVGALVYRLAFNPLLMKLGGKYTYPLQTRRFGADQMLFIDYGYEEDPPMGLPLAASDEPNRYGIQLYHRTATQADLGGKQVLEVSCGHGGGAAYLVNTFQPASYTGLDLNPVGLEFCRKQHRLPGLDFVHGNAEDLPFADQSFDAVINIEASHYYPRFPRFLTEVARVLRPGGHFLYADLRRRDAIAEWEAALAAAPMQQLSQEVINAQVLRGLQKNSQRTQDLIRRNLPSVLRGSAAQFAVLEGSRLYRAIESGEVSYRIYSFVRV